MLVFLTTRLQVVCDSKRQARELLMRGSSNIDIANISSSHTITTYPVTYGSIQEGMTGHTGDFEALKHPENFQ